MASRIRNIFDQYSKPEDRVTHALGHVLDEDPELLKSFLHWGVNYDMEESPVVIVQDTRGDRDSIPDMTLGTPEEFECAFESKIVPGSLNERQLRNHWQRVQPDGSVLAVTPDQDEPELIRQLRQTGIRIQWKRWRDVHNWVAERSDFGRPNVRSQFCDYLIEVESQLQEEGKEVMLTTFHGVHIGKGEHVGGQARAHLRYLRKQLEASGIMRREFPGRREGVGRAVTTNWTSLGLVEATDGGSFNNYPHLTIEFTESAFEAFIVLPHAARQTYRKNARSSTTANWKNVLTEIQQNVSSAGRSPRPTPFIHLAQRHWLSRNAPPEVDGDLRFTLDTLSGTTERVDKGVKPHDGWHALLPGLVAETSPNMEMQIGISYPYERCRDTLRSPKFAEHLIRSIVCLKPFLRLLMEGPGRTRRSRVSAS